MLRCNCRQRLLNVIQSTACRPARPSHLVLPSRASPLLADSKHSPLSGASSGAELGGEARSWQEGGWPAPAPEGHRPFFSDVGADQWHPRNSGNSLSAWQVFMSEQEGESTFSFLGAKFDDGRGGKGFRSYQNSVL